MKALTIITIAVSLIAASLQLYGAYTYKKPWRFVKFSYGVSAFVAAVVLYFYEYNTEQEYGYAFAFLLVMFNIAVGALVRIIYIKCKGSAYRECIG